MVQQRMATGKPVGTNQFLMVEGTIGLTKLSMAFVGNLAQVSVKGHVPLPTG